MSFVFIEISEWVYNVYYGGVLIAGLLTCLGFLWDGLRDRSRGVSMSALEVLILPVISLILGLFWPLAVTFVALWACFVGTLWLSRRIHARAFRRAHESSP